METTIAGPATALGQGGIGIIRVSGPQAWEATDRLFSPRHQSAWEERTPWRMYLGTIGRDGKVIDEAIVVLMKGPHSYTAEDVAEIHSHGGMLVQQKILDALADGGVEPAEPGEFTKRAFLNGRLDLVQAESVMDIIEANNERGLEAANRQLQGGLSQKLEDLRVRLLHMLASVEASLDFPDDEIDAPDEAAMLSMIRCVKEELETLIASYQDGRMIRDGVRTAIIGRPNVGKSSLLNMLLRDNRAIVTEVPGTTRDTIEEMVNLGGLSLRMVDTAGIRDTEDAVERIGIEKSREALERADLVLFVLDAGQGVGPQERRLLDDVRTAGKPLITVLNKTDLASPGQNLPRAFGQAVAISARHNTGMEALVRAIREAVALDVRRSDPDRTITRARHHALLKDVRAHLGELETALRAGLPMDFASIDLRAAYEGMSELLGHTVSDEVFDTIFSAFCLGK